MFSTTDTIVAIATAPGRSALGIVRFSGPAATAIVCRLTGRARPLVARRATFTRLADPELSGSALDQVIVTWFPAPGSYTGEDVVEVSAHGNPWLLSQIVRGATDAGARVAEPGEFTLRAYLNGRMDLIRAEAVADLIAAVTPAQARAASDQLNGTLTTAIGRVEQQLFDVLARLEASIDFPEEGYHFIPHDEVVSALTEARSQLASLVASSRAGRVLREGRRLAIVGRPNSGKSSLFNALVGGERAIVSDEPGTTRDLVSEQCDVHGIPLVLVDTAGWRRTRSLVEAEGVRRAEGAARAADIVVVVVDGSSALTAADRALLDARTVARVVAVSKSDLPAAWELSALKDASADAVRVSAATGEGLDALRSRLVGVLVGDARALDDVRVTNVRHAKLLERAQAALAAAEDVATDEGSEEMVVADVREALGALQEITGKRTPDAVLQEIFSRFCLGK
jgi:tRNA modification GTPase